VLILWRHNIQHDDTQHPNIQHNNIQHKNKLNKVLSITTYIIM
jgi:hypothetical protein